MKLSNASLEIGVVQYVEDDKKLGRVKVVCPKLFPADEPEKLPWVYPIGMAGYSQFRSPKEGDIIWILNNTENYMEYWYFPYFQLTDEAKSIVADYPDAEIVYTRKTGDDKIAQLYHNAAEGTVMRSAGGVVNINSAGDCIVKNAANSSVSVQAGQVLAGADGKKEQAAVLGNHLNHLFVTLESDIQALMDACKSSSPYTSSLVPPLAIMKKNLSENRSKILSQNIFIN